MRATPRCSPGLQGQGAQARQALDRIEGRVQMEKRIAEISAATGDSLRDIIVRIARWAGFLSQAGPRRGSSSKLVNANRAHGAERS